VIGDARLDPDEAESIHYGSALRLRAKEAPGAR
jgi:hypothetical protein